LKHAVLRETFFAVTSSWPRSSHWRGTIHRNAKHRLLPVCLLHYDAIKQRV